MNQSFKKSNAMDPLSDRCGCYIPCCKLRFISELKKSGPPLVIRAINVRENEEVQRTGAHTARCMIAELVLFAQK